jgi:hypothetical protein
MRKALVAAGLSLLLIPASGRADADAPPPASPRLVPVTAPVTDPAASAPVPVDHGPAAPAPAPRVSSYRLEAVVIDGATAALGVGVLFATGGGSASLLPLLPYAFAVPTLHAIRGRSGAMFASVGLRVGLPLIGAALLGSAMNKSSSGGGIGGIVFGSAAGFVAAIAIDDGTLCDGDAAPAPPPALVPTITPTSGGVSLGLAGAF